MVGAIRGSGIGGGGGCFHGDTLISAPNGAIKISDIKPKTIIFAFDDQGSIYQCKVDAVHFHEREEVWRYKMWGGRELLATRNHWVLNQYGAFVEIGALDRDDCLVDDLGHLRPLLSSELFGYYPVYNLTVDHHHTYFANSFRVHNAGLGYENIIGSGGKKQKKPAGQRAPRTADDNLNSTQYARILCLLGEGEQEGFPSGKDYDKNSVAYEKAALKDIYLNQTQILKQTADPSNPQDSDYNFKGVVVSYRNGTANQSYIGGFNQSESQKSVNLTVTKETAITRSISDTTINAVKVTLTWQALQQYFQEPDPSFFGLRRKNKRNYVSAKSAYLSKKGIPGDAQEGDIIATEVKYQIQIANSGGSFSTVVDTSVKGRTGDAYQRSHEIPISGPFPVDVRVLRVTNDSTDDKVQDTMTWSDYTEIVYAKASYPYSALLGVQIDAKYFNSWPTISTKRRGIKVFIPNNATVDLTNGRLIYSGIWDGNFGAAQWTTDPAWCLWDLVTNCRYGFGQHCQPSSLDKWSFYAASQYCAELVPDGKGGAEPRFSCSVNIQNQSEGFNLINQLCSVFRAMPYWGNNLLNISQDRPSNPIMTFHNSDVKDGQFRYIGASLRSRHTVAVVKYFSNDLQDYLYESIEDTDGIDNYGAIVIDVDAFACTSRGQARRLGEWLLYTEQQESEILSFEGTLAAGAQIRPGQLITVMDDMKTGLRRGGKIVAGTTSSLTVDNTSQTDLQSGPDATIAAMLVNGTVESRSIASINAAVVSPSAAFSAAPLVGGTWHINNNLAVATTWRVITIDEKDGSKYTVNAIRYNQSKYAYIERKIPLDETQYAPIKTDPPPSPVSATAAATINPSTNQTDLHLSWASVPGAVEYEVSYRAV
jgi:predicted phage tail protein